MNESDAVTSYGRTRRHAALVCLGLAALVALAGCATTGPRATGGNNDIAAQVVEPTLHNANADHSPIVMDDQTAKAPTPVKPEIKVGTGKFINEQAARAATQGSEAPKGQVVFNFENEPVQAVVKAILGDLLQKNYIIAPGVTGNVSYSTSQPVRTADAMPILETLLSWTNNTLIFTDGRYTVLPIKQAIPGNLTPRLAPAQTAKGYTVRIFPLHYISPSEMQKLLKPFAQPDAFINVDTSRSMLVMAGTPEQLQNYQHTIDIFDVDWLKGMSIGVYNMQSQDVTKIMPQLDQIFGAKGESPLAGMFRFVPVEATNSIIVITSQPEYLSRAEEWLMRLDAGASGDAGSQIYIYDVLNVKAADLAGYLNEIFNGVAYTSSSSSGTGGNVAPGLTQTEVGGSRMGGNNSMFGNNNRQQRQTRRNTTPAPRQASAMPTDGGPRITSVDENNQLLVLASPSQWAVIQQAARRLDIAPLQVQVEAKILEVQLSGNFKFGVQWYLEGLIGSGTAGGPEGRAQPGNKQAWALGGAAAATIATSDTFFYSFVNNELQVALHAMESSGNTKILSAPSVVVLNNQEASINVGDQIPVVQTFLNPGFGFGGNTNGSNGGLGGTSFNTGSVSFRDTGIQLNVTPRVNPGGLVYLDIDQEVSKPGAKADPTGNVPISQRSIQTQVAVQSGETVLLGGLIQENEIQSDSGVPLLSRIPLLGKLFSTTSHDRNRTELIVLITPRVIYNSADAVRITREYQMRFESLKPLRAKLESGDLGAKPEDQPALEGTTSDGQPTAVETIPLPASPSSVPAHGDQP